MKIKTVAVTYERKLNLGDFNSARVECSLWADLDNGDDENVAMSALWEMAKSNVKAQLAPLTTKISLSAEQVFLGLPVDVRDALVNPFVDDDLTDGDA